MENKIILIVGGLAIALCVFMFIMGEISEDNACKEIGFEKGVYKGGMSFCEDIEGNLHYVKMDWGFPPFIPTKAKPISVGDVRTINKRG